MTTNRDQKGNYARVNGLDLYYELHGSRQPLVVLPGSFWTIEEMGELVPQLATTRRVISLDRHPERVADPLNYVLSLTEAVPIEMRALASMPRGTAMHHAVLHPSPQAELPREGGWVPTSTLHTARTQSTAPVALQEHAANQ